MERCLLELIERLPSAQKMDQKLEEIIEMLRTNLCYQPIAATDQPVSLYLILQLLSSVN